MVEMVVMVEKVVMVVMVERNHVNTIYLQGNSDTGVWSYRVKYEKLSK